MALHTSEQATESHTCHLSAILPPSNITFLPLKNCPVSLSLILFPPPTLLPPPPPPATPHTHTFGVVFWCVFFQEPKSKVPLIFPWRIVHLSFCLCSSRYLCPRDSPTQYLRCFPGKYWSRTFAVRVVDEHRVWRQTVLDPSSKPVGF